MEQEHPVHIKIDAARKAITEVLDSEMKKVNESGMAINPFVYAEALIFEASNLIKQSIADSVSEDGSTPVSPQAAEMLTNILAETDALESTYEEFHNSVRPNEAAVLLAMSHSMLQVTHSLNHQVEDEMDQSIPANKVHEFKNKGKSAQPVPEPGEVLRDFLNSLGK